MFRINEDQRLILKIRTTPHPRPARMVRCISSLFLGSVAMHSRVRLILQSTGLNQPGERSLPIGAGAFQEKSPEDSGILAVFRRIARLGSVVSAIDGNPRLETERRCSKPAQACAHESARRAKACAVDVNSKANGWPRPGGAYSDAAFAAGLA